MSCTEEKRQNPVAQKQRKMQREDRVVRRLATERKTHGDQDENELNVRLGLMLSSLITHVASSKDTQNLQLVDTQIRGD